MLVLLLLILPFAFACLMLTLSSRDAKSIFRTGLLYTAVPFVLASALLAMGGGQTADYNWFSFLDVNIKFSLYAYKLSLWMVWLTTLLCFLAFVYSKAALNSGLKEFAVLLLALEGTIIGAFLSAQNLVQFLFFFEAMILPTAISIAFHGGLKRKRAVLVFSLYSLAGSVPLLFASWYLITKTGTDNIAALTETLRTLPITIQTSLLIAFSLAFAVKTPIFPFHSWQSISYSEAPYTLSAILSGAMSKVGVFGFAIWVIPVFYQTLTETYFDLIFISVALFSMLYAGILALRQNNVKKLLAFSSMSHLSLAVAGLFCGSNVVNAGVAVMLIGHGLTAGALFFLGGIAQNWTGSTNIKNFGAFASTNPIYAAIFGFVGIAAIAIPGTIGFVGEFLILQGLFDYFPIFAVIGGVGIIISAAYSLRLIKNMLFGEVKNPRLSGISLPIFEGIAFIPIIVLILYFGFNPNPVLKSFEQNEIQQGLTEQEIQELENYLNELMSETDSTTIIIDSLFTDSLEESADEL